jgi:hypothetical protein
VNFSHCKHKIPEVEGEMEAIIEDIKERRYNTTEYSLDDETDAKAVECIPTSSTEAKERKKVVGLDDLNVCFSLIPYTHVSAQEKGP